MHIEIIINVSLGLLSSKETYEIWLSRDYSELGGFLCIHRNHHQNLVQYTRAPSARRVPLPPSADLARTVLFVHSGRRFWFQISNRFHLPNAGESIWREERTDNTQRSFGETGGSSQQERKSRKRSSSTTTPPLANFQNMSKKRASSFLHGNVTNRRFQGRTRTTSWWVFGVSIGQPHPARDSPF
jgi:hypothetical protein